MMSIEKDILTDKFRNDHHKATVNLVFTGNWVNTKVQEILKEYVITPQQYNVLRILKGQHPKSLSTSDIRDRMLDKMSDASRIVDRLCKRGLVVRVVCPLDKRLVDITLSEEGIQLLMQLEQRTGDLDAVVGQLTSEEAKLLNTLLDKIRS